MTGTICAPDISTTVILDIEEAEKGEIYVCSDGDGIYAVNGTDIRRIGREDGLTSDVVMKIIKDEKRDLYWVVTSNSIEFMKDDVLTSVKDFP